MSTTIQEPTLAGLAEYLHYQYPSTKGDIKLAALCKTISQLDQRCRELEEREKRSFHQGRSNGLMEAQLIACNVIGAESPNYLPKGDQGTKPEIPEQNLSGLQFKVSDAITKVADGINATLLQPQPKNKYL